MSNPRTTRLSVSVAEIALTTSLRAPNAGRQEPCFLQFSGEVRPVAPDFLGDAWALPAQLAGRAITVRCLSAEPTAPDVIGHCQFCPVAADLAVAAEVRCCPKLFHVLKNTAGFSGGPTGAGITLMLDVEERALDDDAARAGAVIDLHIRRIALTASRSLDGSSGPASTSGLGPEPVRQSTVAVL